MDCYRLLQEDYMEDPWRVLLASVLLNQTRVTEVQTVLEQLLDEWPNAAAMANAPVNDIAEIIRPLGLKKFGGYIDEMSADYLKAKPTNWEAVYELRGCGRFAAETWRMLIDEDQGFMPMDFRLRQRMLWWRLDECKMMKNWTGDCGLFFPGTAKGLVYIGIPDGQTSGGYWRDLIVISREQYKKDRWQELPEETEIPDQYSPLTIAKRWLHDHSLVSITDRAKEALMLLVINGKGKFAGKFADDQLETAQKAVESSVIISNKAELLVKVPDLKGMLTLFNSIVDKDKRIAKFEDTIDVDAAADMVLTAAEAKVQKVKEAKPTREPGAKEKLRSALVAAGKKYEETNELADAGMTLGEMATACGGNTDNKRVSDYMCYLKNPKYAGTVGAIEIHKMGDRYTVNKAAADRFAAEQAEKEKAAAEEKEKEQEKNKAAETGTANAGTENTDGQAAA